MRLATSKAVLVLTFFALIQNTAAASQIVELDTPHASRALNQSHPGKGYVSMLGGVSFENVGSDTSVNLTNLVSNVYQFTSYYKSGALVGVEIGHQWLAHHSKINISLGVNTSYTTVSNTNGIVHPVFNIDPSADTLNFSYSVSSIPLLFVLQLGFPYERMHLTPYFIVGAGMSWNKADDYNEIPTNPSGAALPMRSMFQSHTNFDFAYTAGAGLDLQTSVNTRVGIGYRYYSYGLARFSPTPRQATDEQLQLGKVTAQTLLLRMTFLWG